MLLLPAFARWALLGKCTRGNFVDSTALHVCKNWSIHCHKMSKDMTMKNKRSMGWFFGFKLNPILNEKGETSGFILVLKDIGNREPLKIRDFMKETCGKLVVDKDYIQGVVQELFATGIQLVIRVKDNLKNFADGRLRQDTAAKRTIIESSTMN